MKRQCEILGVPEVRDLKYGMDFRRPEYRRECFLRFYEFHLKYRAHPGCVYSLLPFLFEELNMTPEERLWFCFINGNTQHPITSLKIFLKFRNPHDIGQEEFQGWFYWAQDRLEFDLDRRHHKKFMPEAFESYRRAVGESQFDFFKQYETGTPTENFERLFSDVGEKFYSFGRLTTFSYLEYLKIAGVNIDCSSLFLDDIHGSHSQRNGLCKVLGRDDIELHKTNPSFKGYEKAEIEWLIEEGALLLSEARERFKKRDFIKDVSYFTLESTLCTFKSFHRPNRRYPGVYLDMFQGRYMRFKTSSGKSEGINGEIDRLVLKWRSTVRKELRTECVPGDVGLHPLKQNWYRTTGQHIMLNYEWPDVFKNGYNDGLMVRQESLFK